MALNDAEKAIATEVEIAARQKDMAVDNTGDYSGAVAKSDQKEIDLVKKLDRRILPTLWAMYFL